jgi:hypothetical protein
MTDSNPRSDAHIPRHGAYSRVILMSPVDAITGGPEALHQLAFSIRQQGGEAGMAYYAKDKGIDFSQTHVRPQTVEGKALEAYRRYEPQPYQDIELTASDLLVFPEVMASFATMDFACPKAIWWLAVDNALSANPALRYPRMPHRVFEDRDITHFYQSAYARQFLLERGAKKLVPLADYTGIDEVIQWVPEPLERTVDVALFPNKGAELAQAFVASAPELSYTLIQNMSRAEVGEALRQTRVYIDFGGQPGKDRVPREAAISGNVVFLHHQGAGSYYEDSPLDDVYLFTQEDIRTGNLKARVQLVLQNRLHNFEQQSYYRQRVLNEQQEFGIQVRNAFIRYG